MTEFDIGRLIVLQSVRQAGMAGGREEETHSLAGRGEAGIKAKVGANGAAPGTEQRPTCFQERNAENVSRTQAPWTLLVQARNAIFSKMGVIKRFQGRCKSQWQQIGK